MCSEPDNHSLLSSGLVSHFITDRTHFIYLITAENLQKNHIGRDDHLFFDNHLLSIFLPLRWPISPLVLSFHLIIKELLAYCFFYLPLKVYHFPPLAILIGKREKERTEGNYEACFLRVKMGEPGGKIGQFLFEGVNKGK